MCNINFIYNRKKTHDQRIAQFMNTASYNSSIANKDGEGFIGWNRGGIVSKRAEQKIYYTQAFKFYALLSHQRLATSGYNANNIHPHRKGDLELMHNGVFTGLGDKNESDTKQYLDKLHKWYLKYDKNLVKAIAKVNKKTAGSYSIFVYNHANNMLYYYKNYSTSMFMLMNKDWIVMSTVVNNVKFAKDGLMIDGVVKEVKSGVIYDVFAGMTKIQGFKEKPYTYYYGKNYKNSNIKYFGAYGSYSSGGYARSAWDADDDEYIQQKEDDYQAQLQRTKNKKNGWYGYDFHSNQRWPIHWNTKQDRR